jgi:hypothetical protein
LFNGNLRNDNLPPDIFAAIDRFRLDQPELPSCSEAIRLLLDDALIAMGHKALPNGRS